MADNEIDHIEALEKRLYARNPESVPERKYGILHPTRESVDSQWGETSIKHPKRLMPTSLTGYRRFFLVSIIFFVIALGVAFFSVYRAGSALSSKNVEVTVLGNSFVGAGEELPLQVAIANTNAAPLESTTLTLIYPKGAVDTSGGELVRDAHTIGEMLPGKTTTENFTAVLYGEQGTSHTITAHVEYKLAGSNAVFVKEKTFSVIINASPIRLTVDGPAASASNQPFTLTIRNLFMGDKPLEHAIVRVEYPSGYVFQSAVPAPISGNNIWSLGDMMKGTEQVIQIKGKLVGEQEDEKAFRVYVGTPESDTDFRVAVAYTSALHSVIIEQPFVTADITVGTAGADTDVAPVTYGNPIQGSIAWKNNAAIPIANAKFTLAIDSPEIDMASIVAPNANIDTVARTITWSATSDPDIATIDAGASGTFPFTLHLLPDTTTPSDVGLTLSVDGVFPDRDYVAMSIPGIDQKTIRFASQLQFAAASLYSTGGIKNIGPFPPKADVATTYTIQWTILPVQNPLSSVRATAVLPSTVTWKNVIVPSTESLSYNNDNRTVTWDIGPMPKNSGLAQSRSVAFQVEVKPSKTQVGSELQLLGDTTISGTDAIANVPLTATRQALTTRLFSDPAYTPGKEKVVP